MGRRAPCVAISIGFVLLIIFNLRDELRGSAITAFAVGLETSGELLTHSADLEARIRSEVASLSDCQRSVARSRVTATLALLRAKIAKTGSVRRDDQLLTEVRRAVDFGLNCNPLDGNLWLLSGWFDTLAGGDPASFYEFFAMSVALAPLEGAVFEKRWLLVAPAIVSLGLADRVELAPDLAKMMSYAKTESVATVVNELRKGGAGAMAELAISLLAPERREMLLATLKSGDQLPAVGTDKFKQFDFTPVGPVRR